MEAMAGYLLLGFLSSRAAPDRLATEARTAQVVPSIAGRPRTRRTTQASR